MTRSYSLCDVCKAKKVITEKYYTQCLNCGQIYRRVPTQEIIWTSKRRSMK